MKNSSRIDLTEGPILKNLVKLAVPVTVSMVMFTVYLMVDLYFVGRLGPEAVAALSISGYSFFHPPGIFRDSGYGRHGPDCPGFRPKRLRLCGEGVQAVHPAGLNGGSGRSGGRIDDRTDLHKIFWRKRQVS